MVYIRLTTLNQLNFFTIHDRQYEQAQLGLTYSDTRRAQVLPNLIQLGSACL